MHLAFSDDERQLSEELARLLRAHPARRLLSENEGCGFDEALWQALVRDGWLAAALSESEGGGDLASAALCALCEAAGAAVVAVSLPSLFATQRLLRRIDGREAGNRITSSIRGGVKPLLITEGDWAGPPELSRDGVRISGETLPLASGADATLLTILIRDESGARLVMIDAASARIERTKGLPLDLLHPPARWHFDGSPFTVIARGADADRLYTQALLELATFTAFEQLGGAAAALESARQYALGRYAFGRPIGSFQAIKHSLADVLAELELARSNAYFAAACLDGDSRLEEAACVARLTATEAYRFSARSSIQVHGAMGVTWESDCHLHYRRSQALALALGGLDPWRDRLVRVLQHRRTEAA